MMDDIEIKKIAEDYTDELSGEGDYFEEIEKAVTFGLLKMNQQLYIEESQNEMLINEHENLKSDYVVLEEQFKRLQENIVKYQEENEKLKEGLHGIYNLCDNDNSSHEHIWQITNNLLH